MFKEHDPIIQEILQNSGAISPERLEKLVIRRDKEEASLAEVILSAEAVPRKRFFHLIADYLSYDFIEDIPEEISQDALHSIDPEEARRLGVVPISIDNTSLTVIPKDPFNYSVIDELGFVPLSKTGAELLFEVFSQRYERGSTMATTNLPFDEWT